MRNIVYLCKIKTELTMSLFQNHKQKMQELRLNSQAEMRIAVMKMVVPLKIQACERLLLFLERSQLPVLVKRVFAPGVTKEAFHMALLQNVEDEFEHNMAQQLYVSNETWEAVRQAKEELVGQINATFDKTDTGTDVVMVAQALVAVPNPFVEQAVTMLKKEFNEI